jgi:hypothetical protein
VFGDRGTDSAVGEFPSEIAKIVEIPAFADTCGSLFNGNAVHVRPPACTSPTLKSHSRTEVIRSVLDASPLWQRAARRCQSPTSPNRVVCNARQPVIHTRSCSTSARQLTPVDALRSRPARGRDLRRRNRRQRPRLREHCAQRLRREQIHRTHPRPECTADWRDPARRSPGLATCGDSQEFDQKAQDQFTVDNTSLSGSIRSAIDDCTPIHSDIYVSDIESLHETVRRPHLIMRTEPFGWLPIATAECQPRRPSARPAELSHPSSHRP